MKFLKKFESHSINEKLSINTQNLYKALTSIKDEMKNGGEIIEEEDIWQTLLNLGYSKWQLNKKWHYHDMLKYVGDNYGELAQFAILIGKFNQQVTNGGHSQYYFNGYSSTEEFDYKKKINHDIHKLLINMYKSEKELTKYSWYNELYDILDKGKTGKIGRSSEALDSRYYEICDQVHDDLAKYFETRIKKDIPKWGDAIEINKKPIRSIRDLKESLFDQFEKLPSNSIKNQVINNFKIKQIDKNTIELSKKGCQPYRIKDKTGIWTLSEGYQPRVYVPIKFNKVKDFTNEDDMYLYLAKKWNESEKILSPNPKFITLDK
jgi:hypothetical protein